MYEELPGQKRDLNQSPKKLRQEGIIPGVIYGANQASIPVQVDEIQLKKLISQRHPIFELKIDGGKKYLVNLEEVQKDVLHTRYLHVSFHQLKANQKQVFTLPVTLHNVGKAKGAKEGGIVHQLHQSLHVVGLPKDMPDSIEVDCTQLELGQVIHARELNLPTGIEIKESDLDYDVVNCSHAKVVEEAKVEPLTTAEQSERPQEETTTADEKETPPKAA